MKRLLLSGLIIACMPLHASAAPAAPAKRLTIADYFKAPVIRNALLSPNGRYVLITNYPPSKPPYVTLVDMQAQISVPLAKGALAGEYFSDLAWVSNDTVVFDDHISDQFDQLVTIKWDGMKAGKPQVKFQAWPGIYWVASPLVHDGDHMLIATHMHWKGAECTCVFRVDTNLPTSQLDKLKPAYILDPDVNLILADENGKPAVIETENKDSVRRLLRYASDGKQSGKWQEFKKLTKDEQLFEPILVLPNGRDLVVLSNIGRDTVGCFTYNPVTGKILQTLYTNKQYDIADFHVDRWTNSLTYLTWYMGTSPNYQVMDSRAKKYMPALHAAFPHQQVVPWNISASGNNILVYVYSDTNAGAYYALNVATHQAELLGAKRPWLKSNRMVPVKSGSVHTRDGFNIAYLLALPASGHAPYPMVVIPHGGPIGVFNVDSFDDEVQLLASRGFAVLKVNYRGSGGSGKKFVDAGKHQWGRKIEDDIQQVVEATLQSAPVDKNRICIFGTSYGGYSALMSVIRNPGLFKCAASYAGVTDLPLLYDTTTVEYDKQIRDTMADIIGDPTTDAAKLRAVSPVYLVDKIERPIFIAQGGKDTRVDEEQAYRLKLVMDTLHKPLEFHVYPNEIHGFRHQKDEIDFYTRLLKFFDRNIGPGAAEIAKAGPK